MDGTVANLLDITARHWQGERPIPHSKPHGIPCHATRVPQKIPEFLLARSGYCVRHANSLAQRKKACALINSMYAWRGYATYSTAALQEPSNCVTLEASTGKKVFGTLTVAIDSAEGLFADELYRSEINILRRTGRKVCEITKLAFNPKYSSKEVIASLFHLAHIYAHNIHNATDILIEVNPHHVGFYQRRLGFQQIGEPRICARVNAPAILLRVSTNYVASQISKHAGFHDTSEKSLYSYFFSAAEVRGLTNKMPCIASLANPKPLGDCDSAIR